MISLDRLKTLLDYDKQTGQFTWLKQTSSRVTVGASPDRKDPDGYLVVMLDGKNYRQHRLAWFYVNGFWPKKQIDHVNGLRHDNCIVNLRQCDEQDNNRNRGLSRNNTSGISGVSFQQGRWCVRIRTDKTTRMFFGYYDDLELAELVAAVARDKYHGEFAKHSLRK